MGEMLDFHTGFSFLPSRISIQSPARLHSPLPPSDALVPTSSTFPVLHCTSNLNAHIIVVLGARDDETARTGSEWRALLTSNGSVSLVPSAPDGGDASCIQLCRPPRVLPSSAGATHFVRNFFAYICRDRPWQE